MRRQQNHVRYLAAAAVLAIGSASAASVYLKPPSVSGPNPAQLRQLAERVNQEQPDTEPVLLTIPQRRDAISTPQPERAIRPARPSVAPAVSTKPTADAAPQAPDAHAAAEAAVKQIALMGVTQHGDETNAWLVDLQTREREVAASGDSAFGFTVKEVGPESVLLVQGDEQFTLHLGEKEIPVTEAEAPADPALAANGDNRNGRGRWGGRSWGGGNWSGGRSSGGWRGGGSFGSYSGRSGGGNGNWSGGRSFSSNSQRSFGGFGGGFGGNFQGNSRNQNYLKPTANPQEARRRNTRLIGGSNPLPQLQTPRNPQTQRRRGTNSGRAFGSDPNWR